MMVCKPGRMPSPEPRQAGILVSDFHTPEPSGTWPVCMHQSQISNEFILLAATHSAEREEAKNISLP